MPTAVLCRHEKIIQILEQSGIRTIVIPPAPFFANSTKMHADIQLFAAKGAFFVHPGFSVESESELSQLGSVIRCSPVLKDSYPHDCSYNAFFTGKYLFHNLALTAPEIMIFCKKNNIKTVHINQGYSRCSILPVSAEAAVTSDIKAAESMRECGIDVLLIRPGGILLEGFKYGFIGGCGGFSDKTVFLSGNPLNLPDGENILAFAEKHGKNIVSPDGSAVDIGSIIFLDWT